MDEIERVALVQFRNYCQAVSVTLKDVEAVLQMVLDRDEERMRTKVNEVTN